MSGAAEPTPTFPLRADEWEFHCTGDGSPDDGAGWWLVQVSAVEQSVRFQGFVMYVWARQKKPGGA